MKLMPSGSVLALVMIGLTLKLSVSELVELQGLRRRDLRSRFDLPRSCEPSLSAMRMSRRGRVTVVVTCADDGPTEEALPP